MMHTRSCGPTRVSFHGSEWQTKWWFLAYNYSMWYLPSMKAATVVIVTTTATAEF
jgi:hypothetical protein